MAAGVAFFDPGFQGDETAAQLLALAGGYGRAGGPGRAGRRSRRSHTFGVRPGAAGGYGQALRLAPARRV